MYRTMLIQIGMSSSWPSSYHAKVLLVWDFRPYEGRPITSLMRDRVELNCLLLHFEEHLYKAIPSLPPSAAERSC
jgi:hypothetical protein